MQQNERRPNVTNPVDRSYVVQELPSKTHYWRNDRRKNGREDKDEEVKRC
jgi:hypothetical protein